VAGAEVVVNVQTRQPGEVSLARLVQLHQLAHHLAQGVVSVVTALERRDRQGALEHARADWVPLGVVAIQEAVWRCSVYHLRELPSQVHRILNTDVESLSTYGGMHVRRVASQEHATVAVGGRLTGHVGKPRDPGRVANTVVRPVHSAERLAQIAQIRLVAFAHVPLADHDAHTLPVFQLAYAIDTAFTAAEPPRGLLCRLGLGDQVTGRRIPAREVDGRLLADQAAAAVASNEILTAQDPAVGQLDAHPTVVLSKIRDADSTINRHRELGSPVRQYSLDLLLPDPEEVAVPTGQVADVKKDVRKRRDPMHLALRKEAFRDSTLVEQLDRARVEATRA
jgi:hypothetical protein